MHSIHIERNESNLRPSGQKSEENSKLRQSHRFREKVGLHSASKTGVVFIAISVCSPIVAAPIFVINNDECREFFSEFPVAGPEFSGGQNFGSRGDDRQPIDSMQVEESRRMIGIESNRSRWRGSFSLSSNTATFQWEDNLFRAYCAAIDSEHADENPLKHLNFKIIIL